ncbi:MAG: 23S rRNA (pseudouridine(1915)-N(3))-methyltransferase RlmH [Bacteroidetes bacterium GWA2_30_7]|nr:MAG: 23S rRNA (pseudouridine(1915)-N(3))-methyltransferase RlmH [Bacteroidetes bacterium GWA2_30_7]
MKITLIFIGKTDEDFIKVGIEKYVNRLNHYIKLDIIEIKNIKIPKSITKENLKSLEYEQINKHIIADDTVYLLDENGKELTSVGFSDFIKKSMLSSIKNLVFIVGGAYGFSEKIEKRAIGKISLSKMTFTHQMIRLIAVEQIYRAFTIINNEPYHHN